jgi:disulfide bond formation protein DsbB
VYASLVLLFAAGGMTAAGRQLWLQSLPPDKVPQCGPDLYFMLQNFPLSRTLEKLITGTGECAVVDWSFLGLSIAGWSLVWFVILALYAAWLALRSRRASAAWR